MKKKILIFCDFYLPSQRSGGGMWTVVNLVDRFCHKYEFFIVTRNHDTAPENKPFDSVKTGDWNEVRNAKVFYFGKGRLSVADAASMVNLVKPDAIFLNSAFGMPGRRLLDARRKGFVADIPVIVAPCGEFGPGALSLKPTKKRLFLRFAKLSHFYRNVLWKATSETEKLEILNVMGDDVNVMIASDLVPATILPDYSQSSKPKKESGSVRFVVLARIVEKKNIHFFLECLRGIKGGKVEVDIVGPIEDEAYWKRCQKLIEGLPAEIRVNVFGTLEQPAALDRLFQSHFFVLPSLHENFGYVFIEALAAGCPLLISDQTIWNDIEARGVGWTVPLDQPGLYVQRINECIEMDDKNYSKMSAAAREYALKWLADPSAEMAMDLILERALKCHDITANG